MNEKELVEIAKEYVINVHELYPNAERDSLKKLCKPGEPHTDIYRTALIFNGFSIQEGSSRDFDWIYNSEFLFDEDEVNDSVVIIVLNFEIEESIYNIEQELIESDNLSVQIYFLISDGTVVKSVANPY